MAPKPNIVLLLSDQHRYDAVGCNGAPVCLTPAIDSVANVGMRFTRAYTPIALCTPARACLVTGLYSHNHGQLANMGNFNRVFDDRVLDKQVYPRLLSASGYQVGYTGKWHLPKEGDTEFWGFNRWHTTREWMDGLRSAGIDYDYGHDDVQRLEWGGDAPFCGRSTLSAEQMQEAWVADRTIDMIREFSAAEAPFMVCAAFHGPHFPYAVPQPYDTMYDPSSVEKWENFDEQFVGKPLIQQKEMLRWNASHLTWPEWQRVIAHYWGYVSYIDAQIKRVTACLEERGVANNTIVIFTTDHGDMLGSHRLFNKGFNMYEEDTHIPLLIRWPGVTAGESVSDRFVNLVDLMPTILEVAGAGAETPPDGRSLVPLLHGRPPEDWPDDVFVEFHGYEATLASIRMVRTDRWKYVYNPTSVDELYDMESDPGELHNLAGTLGFAHVLRRMKRRMVDRLRATGDGIVAEHSWQSNSYDLYVSKREE